MNFKYAFALAAALSLSASPALAAAARPAPPVAQPAPETVEGSELYRSGIVVPLIGVLALALLVYIVINSQKDDDSPVSP